MKFKLDENVDARLKATLVAAGHDAHTVIDEGLKSDPDPAIWKAAQAEERTLVTQDKDFSNVLAYPVDSTPGIVVLRGPDTSYPIQQILVRTLLAHLAAETPTGRLWIVEAGRVRIRGA